jgi:hypothetical protein
VGLQVSKNLLAGTLSPQSSADCGSLAMWVMLFSRIANLSMLKDRSIKTVFTSSEFKKLKALVVEIAFPP